MENIWTRERHLEEQSEENLDALRTYYKSLKSALSEHDWVKVEVVSGLMSKLAHDQMLIDRELGNVSDIIDAFERIEKRMEQLEAKIKGEGDE